MLRVEDLADWLTARGIQARTLWNIMPDEGPPEAVVANVIPGLQSEIEDAFDNVAVKIRSRAATSTAAQDLAHGVDRAVMDAVTPFRIAGVPVVRRARFGGPPWPIGVDRHEWSLYECNYVFTVAR